MAEPLDDAAIRQLAAAQEKAMADHIAYLSQLEKNNKDSLANFLKEKKNWAERDAAVKEFIKQTKSIVSSNALGGLVKGIKGNFAGLADISTDLRVLDSVIEKTTDAEEKRVLGIRREELVRKSINSMLLGSAVDFAGSIRKLAITGIADTTGKFVKGLQDNSSATSLSSTLMTGAVDIATGAVSQTGQALGKAGEVVSNFGGKAKFAGLAAQGLGMALTAFGETANKVAKFGIEVLSKEVEKTVKAFNDSSAAGALFTDGMTGMRQAANSAGLNLEQFSNVLKRNSEDLGRSGLGVTEGIRTVGRVSKELKTSGISAQLQKLGFGFEEQADLIAETTANMRRSAGGTSSDAEIATQTAKYAENLRTIAAITGEDAKKKTEEVKAQNQILAFQQEMARKSPEQRAQIDAAMATMTEIEKKNFRDRMVFGSVINKEGAVYEATMAGAREKGQRQLELVEQNLLTAESNAKLNAEFGPILRQSGLNNRAIGAAALAGKGGLESLAKATLDAINQSNIYTDEAVKNGKIVVRDQKNTSDDLTESLMSAADAAQELKVSLEEELTPAIGMFADVSKKMLQVVKDQLKDLNLSGEDEETPKTKKEKWADRAGKVSRGALEYGGAAIGGVAASLIPGAQGWGSILGATAGQQGGKMLADLIGLPKFAQGGITKGLSLAGESGPEAVIPLPDNRKVPVQLDMSGFNDSIARLSSNTMPIKLDMINFNKNMFDKTETMPMGNLSKTSLLNLSTPDFSKIMTDTINDLTRSASKTQKDETGLSKVEILKLEKVASDNQTINLLKEQIELMKQYISKSDDHLEALRDSNYLQKQLVNNSYS